MARKKWQGIRLEPDEVVLHEYQPSASSLLVEMVSFHPKRFLLFSLMAIVVALAIGFITRSSLIASLIFVLFYGIVFADWSARRQHWAVTNKRLIGSAGVFNRHLSLIDHDKIINLEIDLPFMYTFLGSGRVIVGTGSAATRPFIIYGQTDPVEVAQAIREAMAKFSLARGFAAATQPTALEPFDERDVQLQR